MFFVGGAVRLGFGLQSSMVWESPMGMAHACMHDMLRTWICWTKCAQDRCRGVET